MNDLLLIIIFIILLSKLIITIYSCFSLKKYSSQRQSKYLDGKFIIENIIHLRTSINVLYASIGIITFVLAFLGFNIQKNISKDVKDEIMKASSVDLYSLKMKSEEIVFLDSISQKNYIEINKINEQTRSIYDKLKNSPQKLYIVEGIKITKEKKQYLFSEFTTIEGMKIPKFEKPPFIFMQAYRDGSELPKYFKVNLQGIEIDIDPYIEGSKNCSMDLWIYVR